MAVLAGLAAWQFRWMGTDLSTPISHGVNEDWDWQLTLYEVSRASILDFHEFPAWTPYTQGGVPLLANPESPFFYPPFLLVLVFGTHMGLKLWILFHLGLLALGGWWAGREMGLGPFAAQGAGLLILCSAFLPDFVGYGHIMYLPLGWLPLAWVAWRRGRWRLAGICLAMTLLGGGHYLLIYGGLWLSVDFLFSHLSRRTAWTLGAWMGLNLLLLGQSWAAWPLGVLGIGGFCLVARDLWRVRRALVGPMSRLVGTVLLAALLAGPKLATLPALWHRAERLAPQESYSIADEYTPLRAWRVLVGAEERPSGHEGQNVLYSPVPLVLGIPGVAIALARQPAVALSGLLFMDLGWGGSTPVNLLQGLHRLPLFSHVRVVERYSLVWTLFLGWFAGFMVQSLVGPTGPGWRALRPWVLGALCVGLVGWHVGRAAPLAARPYWIGPGRPNAIPPAGDFFQSDDELTNWEAVISNRGKPRCWTTAWLADPAPVLTRGAPDYRGEVARFDAGTATWVEVPARITPNHVRFDLDQESVVVVNQNAFEGWRARGSDVGAWNGLLSLNAGQGAVDLAYRPPGLPLGLGGLAIGLGTLGWPILVRVRRRARG